MGVPNLPIGIGPPNVLDLWINQQDSALDLSTVTALTLNVTRSLDGSTATWDCDLLSQTTEQLHASYSFADDDVPVVGIYELAPVLTVPDGLVPCYALRFMATLPGQTMLRTP